MAAHSHPPRMLNTIPTSHLFAQDISSIGSSSHRLIRDIGPRTGDSPQMLNRNREISAQARQDEARLLGSTRDYSKKKGAVSIKPGMSKSTVRKKVPGSSFSPKPADRISPQSRDSGPVRANGNQNSSTSFSHGEEFQPSNRPSKRARHDSINFYDLTGDGSSIPNSSPPRQRLPSQASAFHGATSRHGEFRDVEASIQISRTSRTHALFCDHIEEKFTAQANQQRRSSYSPIASANPNSAITIIDSSVTPKVKDSPSGKKPLILEKTKKSPVLDPNDSSDELQGGTTTQPVPKVLVQKKAQTVNPLSPPRRRSPSDIEQTKFEPSRNGPKKLKRFTNQSHKRHISRSFEICSIRYGPTKKDNGSVGSVKIAVDLERIVLGEDIVGPLHDNVDIPIRKVQKFIEGEDPSHKARLFLSSSTDSPNNLVDIEFLTRDEMLAFRLSLENFSIKFFSKDVDSIDKMFGNHERQMRQAAQAKVSRKSEPVIVKTYSSPEVSERSTRSSTRLVTGLSDLQKEQDREKSKSPEDTFRERWTKPMVYPRIGKNRFEVTVEDRDRLREGEFLNDNLIGFYLRFLQDHLERNNKEVAKRVYFFNSYFFDTLTKVTEGEQGINYSGVEKWTRNVDLFSYDYVVVPINQSAHWYLAIICNLPYLMKEGKEEKDSVYPENNELSSQPQIEVDTIPETPESQLAPNSLELPGTPEETDQEQAVDASQADVSSGVSKMAENEDFITESSPNLTRSGRQRKLKVLKLTPTIITFDSLDTNRTLTINKLREYIRQEAASKRAVLIETSQIKGKRANHIPLQPNFSDCGLYLMAYVEKFVQDPDSFIAKMRQRNMDTKSYWPKLLSGILRNRLRQFLDDMYEEQGEGKSTEVTTAMADRQPVSFLLGSPTPEPQEENVESHNHELQDLPVESPVDADKN